MTTTLAPKFASPAQLSYIDSIMTQRVVSQDLIDSYKLVRSALTVKDASTIINNLKDAPYKPKAAAADVSLAEVSAALRAVPKSKYALKFEDVGDFLISTPSRGNDLLFLEIKEYHGNIYINRLTGSVGYFNRTRIARADALSIAKFIARDPLAAARLFGTHYQCCGSCGADLTDVESRRLQLGPDCRKKFGL